MATLIPQMTKEKLVQVIETTVERKLLELFEELDDGLALRPDVKERLLTQQEAVVQGERGRTLDEIIQELDLG